MKRWGLIIGLLFVLVSQWEYQRTEAAILWGTEIPDEAIRMRILANSDHPLDQLLKRQVRDQVIALVTTWDLEWTGVESARDYVDLHLAEIEQVVRETIHAQGYDYAFSVELAEVPFPDKVYGNQYYPAGEYEAVRITIGEGKGENWWCVLFPPLCFVDVTTAETAPGTEVAEGAVEQEGVVIRFFLIDWLIKLFQFIQGLFA